MYRRAKGELVFEVGIFEDRFFRLSGAQSYFACRHSLAGKLLLIVILLCIVASSCSVEGMPCYLFCGKESWKLVVLQACKSWRHFWSCRLL